MNSIVKKFKVETRRIRLGYHNLTPIMTQYLIYADEEKIENVGTIINKDGKIKQEFRHRGQTNAIIQNPGQKLGH